MDLSLNNYLIWSIVAACIVFVALWWYVYHSSRSVQDTSSDRSMHQGVALTGAGLLMFIPICFIGAIQFPLFLPLYLLLIMSVIGWFDDRFDLSAKIRLLSQSVIAFGLLLFVGFSVTSLLFLFLLLALMWWINLFNFMDGANGQAGIHALLTVSFYGWLYLDVFSHASVLHYLGIVTVLVLMVYLLFNVVLQKLFMGDSGSLPLAMLIAVLALYLIQYNQLTYFEVALVHAAFIVDATATLFYRIFKGENIAEAHATHLYQRLIKNGFSHLKVSLIYALITLVCIILVLLISHLYISDIIVLLMVYVVLFIIFMKTLRVGR